MKLLALLCLVSALVGCSLQLVSKKDCYQRMQEVIREIDRQIQGPSHLLHIEGPRTRWDKVVEDCVK